ncbi:DUF2057 domain-containing protein [Colwellia sp. MSW7]|uniref:DUF2057 domain-containing protein n=1 Tax=Colwellia maritima TaxID=2912588 RepID=A0ABS9X1L3_9GAMM|nr:DUF2057 family protein [Colwellia maritima]MCI2284143.1 DUF2057 domain-containing protein [Colwellia maritima]
MIRFIFALCLFLVASVVSFTLWATTLTVGDNLVISQINNKIVEHGFLDQTSEFSLKPGQYAFIVHYKDVFEDLTFAEDRVVKSKEFVVKLTVGAEKKLHLMTAAIKNLAQAEAFSKSPTLMLKDENNQQLPIELESVADYKIAEQVELAITSYTSQQDSHHDKAAETTKIKKANQTVTSVKEKLSDNKLIQINALPMLKYWWQNASDEEKKHFKQYINRNN